MSKNDRISLCFCLFVTMIVFCVSCEISYGQPYPYYIQDVNTGDPRETVTFSWIGGINAQGAGVGQIFDPQGTNPHAGISQNNVITDITPGFIYGYSSAIAINDKGYVVGNAQNNGSAYPFLYNSNSPFIFNIESNGIMSNGQVIYSNESWADGINNNGQVVGAFYYTDAANNIYQHAYIYNSNTPNPQMQDIGQLIGNDQFSFPYAINNKGQVILNATDSQNGYHAYFYYTGSMTQINTLGGAYNYVYDINNKGQIVGYSLTSNGSQHAFLYSNGSVTDIDPLGQSDVYGSLAKAINDNGQIVGEYNDGSGGAIFLYSNGYYKDLGSIPSEIANINNRGQVLTDTKLYSGGVIYNISDLIYPNLVGGVREWNNLALDTNYHNGNKFTFLNDSGQIIGLGQRTIYVDDSGDTGTYSRGFIMTPFPWCNPSGGNWGDVSNWKNNDYASEAPESKSVPGKWGSNITKGDTATFGPLFDNNGQPFTPSPTVTLDDNYTVSCLAFNNNLGSYTISSGSSSNKIILDNTDLADNGQPLNLSVMIVVSAGNHYISAPIQLNSNLNVETLENTSISISGQITEPNGQPMSLNKTSEGTLILSGENNYTGDTIIEEGILALDTDGQINKASKISTDSEGTFQINAGSHTVGTISGMGTTIVISGELKADSISQNTLIIGTAEELISTPLSGDHNL